jgi:hypothetical protein
MSFLNPRALRAHAIFFVGLSLLLVAVWALTTGAYFWPIHAVLPLAALLMLHGWLVSLHERPGIRERFGGSWPLAVHAGASAAQWLYLVALWLEGGRGYFWPAWPLLGLALLLGVHVLKVFRPAPGDRMGG